MNHTVVSLLGGILLVGVFTGLAGAGEGETGENKEKAVVVAPFQVNSDEPIGYAAKAFAPMLASRLDADPEISAVDEAVVNEALARRGVSGLDEESAREIGRELGAACVVLGTITKIGESLSVDVKVVDVEGAKPTASVFYEDKTLKGLIEGAGALAKKIGHKIFDRVVVAAVAIRGNRLIEDDAIALEIETKVGDAFDSQKVQDDIQRIYDMGYFSDIQVDSIDDAQGKKVTFIVNENPEISEIRVVGNKEVKTSEIQEEIDLKLHTILNLNKAKAAAVQIRKFYQGKGYYNAMVDHTTEDLGGDKVAVAFEIVEQHSMKIKKISITGNKQLKDKQIKGILATREKNILSFFTEAGKFKEEQFQEDLDRVKAFYYDHGFLEIKVGEPQITNDEKWIYIKIPVEEGAPYRLSEVNLAGDLLKPEEELRKSITVVPEELFSREKIQADISALTDVYGEQGYAFVDITPLTNMNADNKTVALTYDIAQGDAVYIERITVTGNDRTQDKVIRREMRLKEEELYNNKKLKRSRERLNNLGYFEDVKLNTRRGSGPDKMAVDVKVKEKPTGMISAGAGYSSVDNLVGIFQISQNNFLGRGLQLTLMGQVGGTSRYRLGVVEPYLLDKEIAAGFDLFNMEMEYDDFDSDNKGLSLSLGILPFKGKEDWRLNFQYGYAKTDISNLSGYITTDPNDPTKIITVYDVDYDIYQAAEDSPIITSDITSILSRDTVDDRFYPMQGSINSLSLQLAGLGGEKFYKTVIDSRWYFPYKWGTAFMARGSAGYARGYGGDEVPVFERFYLGGLDSLRGFEQRTVGPEGDSTQVSDTVMLTGDTCTGGEQMMFFNLEYLFPVIKAAKIRGLVFFDMGNAYGKDESFDFDFRRSIGAGIRWNSPFGPLRVEWGVNLDPEDDEDRSQFEFSAGTGF